MEPSCVRQTLIPGTSKLFGDFLYNFERVSRFYSYNFSDPESFRRAAAQLNYPESRRKQLVSALREQNGDSPALDELAKPETVAVVTGQQVGLLSGPLYTIFKALTAVRLAQELSRQGMAAVPIFWLASEDHDLAEVDHAWLFDQNAKPTKISVTSAISNGGPVGEVVLDDLPFEEIRAALGELPFADDVMERLKEAYHPGVTFSCAFKTFLQGILQGLGLLFLDPLAPSIRGIARPFLAEAAQRVPELFDGLKARDRELASAGYHSQVHLDEGASLLFLLTDDGKRTALRWKDDRFSTKDKSYSTAELQERAHRLSPNALLRPVMQDYLLPTVAYIGGPSEIAYMAQGQVLYQALLGRMPVIFPRNSFTLLDSRAEKLINRYGLRFPSLLDHPEKVKSAIACQLVPIELQKEFDSVQSSMAAAIAGLQGNLHKFDPTLEAAAAKSGSKMLYQLRRLSEKTARETLRRDERSAREADYLTNLVYPHRRLQERFYSIVPFLAKNGLDLPHRLLDLTQLACPDHMIRTV
ncbi:MAG: bacillithiol biosynthesis cysteine-adding enzyme BshC [Acidobacteriota bacterium]|nr:bacillithiol biosynthesis cysteine-adding enzyme BshC [Acidobacteriota bacterium]